MAAGEPGTQPGRTKLESSRRVPSPGGFSMTISVREPGMPQTVSKNSPSTNILPSTSRPSPTKKAVTTSRSATVRPTWSKRRICDIGPSSRRRIDRASATVGVLSTSRCETSATAHYPRQTSALSPAWRSAGRAHRHISVAGTFPYIPWRLLLRQVLEPGWQVGEGVEDVVGRAAGIAAGAWQVLAGLDKDPGKSLALGGEHIGLDVVTDHQRARGANVQVCQRGGEERGGGLANHLCFDTGRPFQARHKRPAV